MTSVTRPPGFLNVTATGTLHGAGFDDTAGTFTFTVTGTGVRFGFAANTVAAAPDGGSAVALLGLALAGVEVLRRKLRIG